MTDSDAADPAAAPRAPQPGHQWGPRWAWVLCALLALVLAVVVVVDPFGDEDDDPFAAYCAAVVEQRPLIGAALEAGPTTGLIRALPSFEALRSEAPADIVEHWDRVIGAIEDLLDVLDADGVDPAGYDRKDPPPGLTRAERRQIDAAATALGSSSTADSLAAVEQQARDVCGSPLSL